MSSSATVGAGGGAGGAGGAPWGAAVSASSAMMWWGPPGVRSVSHATEHTDRPERSTLRRLCRGFCKVDSRKVAVIT